MPPIKYSLDLQDRVSFDLQAAPMEILVPDELSFRWILNGKAIAFVSFNATRRVVDAWINKQMEMLQTWDTNRISFMLNDFSAPSCVVTPYARERINELVKSSPNITAYTTTILGRTALSMPVVLLSNAINSASRRRNKSQTMIFYKHDEAVQWLQRRLAEGEFVDQTTTRTF
ncbi:MAG: hypothetical protein DYG88_17855 [Chloroflexi bacterium CFX4]|nr:hypothetical protein [Chloroflexi bacterium CFX4]MDL1921731.1 hypothetical protein [Chloroflexi bacterium CFX3]